MKKIIDNSNLLIGACPKCGEPLEEFHVDDEMVHCSNEECDYQISVEELVEIQEGRVNNDDL